MGLGGQEAAPSPTHDSLDTEVTQATAPTAVDLLDEGNNLEFPAASCATTISVADPHLDTLSGALKKIEPRIRTRTYEIVRRFLRFERTDRARSHY